jgi:hypothetical protein
VGNVRAVLGVRQGMLAAITEAGGHAAHVSLLASSRRSDPAESWLSFRDRAGLIHDQGIDFPHGPDFKGVAE